MSEYNQQNYIYWQSPYYAPNVESFIFKLDGRLFKKYNIYKDPKKVNLLDFGCGQGSHCKYFQDKIGFNVYGVDISKDSMEVVKKKFPENPENFKLIDHKPSKDDDFFKVKFDIIISTQVFFYLSDTDIQNRLLSLNSMLKEGGYVFFTMMSEKSWYHSWIINGNNKKSDGLLKAEHTQKFLNSRTKKTVNIHYLNLVKDKTDLKKKFHLFKPVEIGEYDLAYNENESEHSFLFFGKKR